MSDETKRNLIALLTAIVLVVTAIGVILAFAQYNGLEGNYRYLDSDFDKGIIAAIIINALVSLFVLILRGSSNTPAATAPKAYWLGIGYATSFFWDAFALYFALVTSSGSSEDYLFLAIILIIDGIIDAVVHFTKKR